MRPNVKTTQDPLDVSMLPPTEGMLLDYRTQPDGEAGERHKAIYRLIATALICTCVLFFCRVFAAYLRTSDSLLYGFVATFWGLIYPCVALIALIKYLRRRTLRHIAGWLVIPPVLWVLIYLTTAGFHPVSAYALIFIPTVFLATAVADRIANHHAAWMAANPLLDFSTRLNWRRRWQSRLRPAGHSLAQRLRSAGFRATSLPDAHGNEFATYSLARLAVYAAALLAAPPLVFCLAITALNLFAGMLATLTFGALLVVAWFTWNHYAQPNCMPWHHVCWISWRALANWVAYNAHETPAPGVFQSPSGTAYRRLGLLGGVLFFLALSVVPMSTYFPVVLLFSGPDPWIEHLQVTDLRDTPTHGSAWQRTPLAQKILRFPGELARSSHEDPVSPPVAAVEPTLDEVEHTLEPPEQLYYDSLTTNDDKLAYLRSIAADRAQAAQLVEEALVDEGNRDALTATPETWLRIAAARTFKGEPLFSFAFFSSLALSILAPVLLFYLILAFLTGRLLLLYYQSLEAPGAPEHAPGLSVWDARVARLRTSLHEVTSPNARVREADHLWLGRSTVNDYPILLDQTLLPRHVHITGSTGSGKTTIGLMPLLTQIIRRRDASMLLLDLKGDPAFFHDMRAEARAAGLPFKWFTNVLGCSTYVFNPLLQAERERLSIHQRTELLLGAFGLKYGRAYGRDYYSDVQSHLLFRALRYKPDCPSFRELYHLLQFRPLYKEMDKQQLRDASHIWQIVDRLASFTALNATDQDKLPQGALDNAIDVADLFRTPSIIYFSLPGAIESVAIAEIARLALYTAISLATTHGTQRPRLYLLIDEFQELVSSTLRIVLEHARGRNISVILANHNMADLKTQDGDLFPIVTSEAHVRQIFSAHALFDQEVISKASGEAMYELYSRFWSIRDAGVQMREDVGPRHRINDIIDFSNHPKRCLMQIQESSGFSQFGGYSFVMATDFHITEPEYRRLENTPWPPTDGQTITAAEYVEPPDVKPPPKPTRRQVAESTYDDMTPMSLDEILDAAKADEAEDGPELPFPPEEPPPSKPKRHKRRKRPKKKGDTDHGPERPEH